MSNQRENEIEWLPKNYEPGFTVENWVMLLQDETIFTPSSMDVIKRIKDFGGIATCVELSQRYGGTPNFYNNNGWQLGRRVYEKTGCPLCQEKDCKYWPVLFWGRRVGHQRNGTYEWKLRDELSVALEILESDAQSREAQIMSLSLLAEAAKQHENRHPSSQAVAVQQIYRSPYIREYARREQTVFANCVD